MKKISVIVPVYNVEEYLEECVNSILMQTYRQLEVILVDDGSTDSSGDICERYKIVDNRIMVIHKKNGGLSDARNAGLAVATGEYIAFVDSDDFIHKDMYSTLVEILEENDADMAIAKWCGYVDEDYGNIAETDEIISLEGIDILKFLIYGKNGSHISLGVYTRLYKRELLEELLFPVGKCYEDVVWSTKVFYNSQKAVFIDKVLYYYRRRKTSITGVDDENGFSERILTDKIPQIEEQIAYLRDINQMDMADEVTFSLYEMLLKYYNICQKNKDISHGAEMLKKLREYRRWGVDYARKSSMFRKSLLVMSIYALPVVNIAMSVKDGLRKLGGK